MVGAFAIWLHYASFGAAADSLVPRIALAVAAAFVLWGCIARGRSDAVRA